MVMGHERTGIFDCMICEGCIIDFIILHWEPALTSLLEFQQCSKNHDTCSFSNSSKPSLVLVPADTYLCTLVSTDETRAIGHLSP